MSNAAAKAKSTSPKGSQGFASMKKTLVLLSMVAPGAIWLVLLRYLPMGGIVMAFKNYKVYTKDPGLINNIINSEWNGIDNFKFIFAGSDAWLMFRNTLGYNAVFIVTGLVVSVTFAVMLNEVTNKFVAKTYQTLMFFPYFLSWVVVSYFLYAFIDPTYGMVNRVLVNWGYDQFQAYNWYADLKPWPYIIVIANAWKNVGYTTILYLAAITGIDATQYEAASIDGATKMQQIFYVTLPHLKTMIVILLIMNVGKIFNSDFGLFYQVPMGSGTLIPITQTIDTYVYRIMTAVPNLGYSTAAGLMQNVIGFICIMTANAVVRKVDEDSSLF
ncbi:MAG: ABC transporter permease subunit [Eubacteriales bacterium]